MQLKQKLKYLAKLKWLLSLAVIFLLIFIFVVVSSLVFEYRYDNKIFPGVTVNNYDLGGLTKEQAQKIIQGNFNQIFADGFTFIYNEESRIIPINHEENILTIHNEAMAQKAFDYGRQNNFWRNFYQKLVLLVASTEIDLDCQFNKNKLAERLKLEFAAYEDPAKDSQVKIQIYNIENKEYQLDFSPEKTGSAFNYFQAIEDMEKHILAYQNPNIILKLNNQRPKITQSQAQLFKSQIIELLKADEITLFYNDEKYILKWEDFAYWINVEVNSAQEIVLGLNSEMLGGQLEAISQQINHQAKNAKFQIKETRVTEFQASQKGLQLDKNTSLAKINNEFINNKNTEIELVVNETEPEITTESINDLGIKELIGIGQSNFSGSPANRRHNIGIGAATLNGMLIKPDEEFSLVQRLGNIDAGSGYLPELVIKENKTVPEYGGGLCQIATTMFRVALDTGLPITERKPHSYRVVYYEPAGLDATIYQPHPDLRFINDTSNYILIQTYIKGNELIFEFYGAADGRQVTITDPKIFNITYPGPTKYIETTELAPGQKKWTEGSHPGADAVFYRTIEYADGTKEEEEWRSHYTAWQSVCLVGVDPSAQSAVE